MRNSALRSNYFQKHLSANPTAKERSEAVRTTLHEFPASTRPPPFWSRLLLSGESGHRLRLRLRLPVHVSSAD
jgi:hypothetical protein